MSYGTLDDFGSSTPGWDGTGLIGKNGKALHMAYDDLLHISRSIVSKCINQYLYWGDTMGRNNWSLRYLMLVRL